MAKSQALHEPHCVLIHMQFFSTENFDIILNISYFNIRFDIILNITYFNIRFIGACIYLVEKQLAANNIHLSL